ncbi:MAG TPA: hypothetical protein VGI75_11295, partial [Pirellulales bacterium]
MATSLADLARIVDGQTVGDGTRIIAGSNTLNAAGPDDITLLDAVEKSHLLARSRAGAVVVPTG